MITNHFINVNILMRGIKKLRHVGQVKSLLATPPEQIPDFTGACCSSDSPEHDQVTVYKPDQI